MKMKFLEYNLLAVISRDTPWHAGVLLWLISLLVTKRGIGRSFYLFFFSVENWIEQKLEVWNMHPKYGPNVEWLHFRIPMACPVHFVSAKVENALNYFVLLSGVSSSLNTILTPQKVPSVRAILVRPWDPPKCVFKIYTSDGLYWGIFLYFTSKILNLRSSVIWKLNKRSSTNAIFATHLQ